MKPNVSFILEEDGYWICPPLEPKTFGGSTDLNQVFERAYELRYIWKTERVRVYLDKGSTMGRYKDLSWSDFEDDGLKL